jgi:hypothetical protein
MTTRDKSACAASNLKMSSNVPNRMLLLASVGALALSLTGCYNDPEVSLKPPGTGPDNYMRGPAVGPGTVAGGSTAGPQPAARPHHGGVEPQPAGAVAGEAGHGTAGSSTPVHAPHADTPRTGAAVTGNEEGGDSRGPATAGQKKDH